MIHASDDNIVLANGVLMPRSVFGTWRLPQCPETEEVVKAAVNVGYLHFDTAAHYANEQSVGKAIKECGKAREELFLTTKLRNSERGYKTAIDDCHRALNELGLDYIDLYLIHWPAPKKFFEDWDAINADTWRAFEYLLAQGKVRSIGVSNFKPNQIDALIKTAKVQPAVNQIKLSPGLYNQQAALIEYCHRRGIVVEAYSPLGAGKLLNNAKLISLAAKYGKSPAQLCLRWCIQHGTVPVAKSSSAERMKANLDVNDFEIEDEDMMILDVLPEAAQEIPDSEIVWRD